LTDDALSDGGRMARLADEVSPMDQIRFVETAFRIEHQHRDGSWGILDEEKPTPLHHTPAEHDPERNWLRGRIFKCRTCDETVTITPGAEGGVPERAGVVGGSAAETARHVVEDG
jgi:hypothetical protein